MTKNSYRFYFFIIVLAFLFGCSKSNKYNLPEQITNSVSGELLDEMTSMGFPIHEGNNPPCIEGEYLASPFKLKGSSLPNEPLSIGYVLPDFEVRFYNQDNTNFSILVDWVNGSASGTGMGAFIAGEGEYFTVFATTTATVNGNTAQTLWAFSGKITSNGIEEFHASNFMLDDGGDPEGVFIPNNTGRVFNDGSLNYLADCTSGDCGNCGSGGGPQLELNNTNIQGVWNYTSYTDYSTNPPSVYTFNPGDVIYEFIPVGATNGTLSVGGSPAFSYQIISTHHIQITSPPPSGSTTYSLVSLTANSFEYESLNGKIGLER